MIGDTTVCTFQLPKLKRNVRTSYFNKTLKQKATNDTADEYRRIEHSKRTLTKKALR